MDAQIRELTDKLMETKVWQPGIADGWLRLIKQMRPSDLETRGILLSSLYREDGTIQEPSFLTDTINRCKNGEGSAEDCDIVVFAWMITKNPDYFRVLETYSEINISRLREQYPQWVLKI